MATTPAGLVPPPAHLSWLKRTGHVLGQILGFIAKDAPALEKIAVPVAEALLPQFAAEIQFADNLFSKIVKQAVVTQGLVAATGAATTGPEKFNAVFANIGPEIDAWIANAFPGMGAVSAVNKAGLVQAVIAIVNEEEKSATP